MRYRVCAYLCTNSAGLMDMLETDIFDEVQDFVWANCQKGYDCEVYDTETGDRGWAYAANFTEATEEPNELYADLRLEQCEQM